MKINQYFGTKPISLGTLICILLLKYWGRKKTLILANSITGVSMLMVAFVDPANTGVIVILATVAITGL